MTTISIAKGEPLELEILPTDLVTGDPIPMSTFDSVDCWMGNGCDSFSLNPTVEESRAIVSFDTRSLSLGAYTADIRFTADGKDQFTGTFRVLITATVTPPSN
jgi:hypothetical protein